MKIWFKLLAGAALGVVLGFLLPIDNQAIGGAMEWLADFAIRAGRYTVVPMIVFSLCIAVYELRREGGFLSMLLKFFIFTIISAMLVIGAGLTATMLFPPDRIPITQDGQVENISLSILQNIMDIFPQNMFSTLVNDGVYLIPVCVFAFFAGLGLSYDRNFTKPVISLVDSLSRIFYHIAAFFSEVLSISLIALSAYWAFRWRGIEKLLPEFWTLIVLLTVVSILLGFVIFPLLLYLFVRNKPRPWVLVYSSISSALCAFFSGDINFTLPVIFRHMKESLGVRRRVIAVTMPLLATFSRAGSAMVATVSLIVIIKSYSSLGITTVDAVSIGLRAFIISFLLARHPGDGAWTALAVLCAVHGRGFESGYLILKPIAFYLIAIGTFLDVMVANFAAYAIAKISGFQEDKAVRQFI
ncbi:MAG: cation:dicarboxylase symporter family transporter [Treponema sp.]|jgi:Na+/H+-dicarboxylate symporter|nr:cation:dicarboxylase symporter family transporter [Treponema sp.]